MGMGLGATVGDTFILHQINQPSTFFKASVIQKLGINEQFRYTMDVDVWFRYLLQAGQSRILLSDSLLTYFRLHDASKSVAEINHFEGDTWKVHYNILYSINQDTDLLSFASSKIPDFKHFFPTYYQVQIPATELSAFVRYVAWLALHYYNEIGNYVSARKCLNIARSNGQPFNGTVLRQLLKHYVLPDKLAFWIAARASKLNL
jgi:hypothetical protein